MEPQTLSSLNPWIIQQLIELHNSDPHKREYLGRTFSHSIDKALEIVRPIVNDTLGTNTWVLSGGNFFDTRIGYRVHTDTGFDGPDKVWQTIVFPLEMEVAPNAQIENNRLIIFNQSWKQRPAFFLRGGDPTPEASKNSSYDLVFDYKDVVGLGTNTICEYAANLCPHLNRQDFEGLTIDQSLLWTPGVPMTFPRDRLHTSTAFPRFGIKRKLGLSLFFSRR